MKGSLLVLATFVAVVGAVHRTHLVFMLIRHGARAPGEVTEPFRGLGVEHPKQLTPIGKLQHEILGKQTRSAYFAFPPQPGSIQLSTSPSTRCIQSMEHFARGFGLGSAFSTGFEVLPKKFFNQRKLSKFSAEQIASFDRKFKRLIRGLVRRAKEHDWDLVRAHYCPHCVAEGSPSALARSLKKLATIVACHHGNEVETHPTKPELKEVIDKAFRLHYTHLAFQSEEDARLYSLDALRVIAKSLAKFLHNFSPSNSKTAAYLDRLGEGSHQSAPTTIMFAHDGNLIGFLRLFEKPSEILRQEFYKPPFAAHVKIEVVQGFKSPKIQSEYYRRLFEGGVEPKFRKRLLVRVKYMDQELKLKQCGHKTCSLQQFVKFLAQKIK